MSNPCGHFSGDYISAIRGCCPLLFLHALEIDPGYLAQTLTGTGVIMCVQLLEGPFPKIWEYKIRPILGALSDNF